ncbi:MAG: hypothetical protein IPJ79_07005 [Bacteroidetes bacterium]|nr:hypothetical protein [Bacteroidota bacterium]
MLIRNNELVPVDATLISGNALIDYSFVTGEALPAQVRQGELIFAGGRQTGGAIELLVAKEVSQSHLTQLWNGSTEKRVISALEIGKCHPASILLWLRCLLQQLPQHIGGIAISKKPLMLLQQFW